MSSTASNDSGTETGASTCDPLADPSTECGPQMRCDLASLACVDALGSGLVDEPCESDDDCSPAYICHDARCRELCSPIDSPTCADNRVCTFADAPIPGLCLEPCTLLQPACSNIGDACKRGVGVGAITVAVCVDNPGAGVEGDGCTRDADCDPGYLCTPAAQHSVACANDASDCCAPLCDSFELLCFGLEPICHVLGISDQPTTGYCGN